MSTLVPRSLALFTLALAACGGVAGENRAPVARAGADRQVLAGTDAFLSGAASLDPDGDLLDYDWLVLEAPEAGGLEFVQARTAHPIFRATRAGRYVVSLLVTDGELGATDELVVEVMGEAERPEPGARLDRADWWREAP